MPQGIDFFVAVGSGVVNDVQGIFHTILVKNML
jgi:hypothetical protein